MATSSMAQKASGPIEQRFSSPQFGQPDGTSLSKYCPSGPLSADFGTGVLLRPRHRFGQPVVRQGVGHRRAFTMRGVSRSVVSCSADWSWRMWSPIAAGRRREPCPSRIFGDPPIRRRPDGRSSRHLEGDPGAAATSPDGSFNSRTCSLCEDRSDGYSAPGSSSGRSPNSGRVPPL
jgi:hypothetical protein